MATRFFQWKRLYMCPAVLFLGVQNSSAVQPIISIERTVFHRERAARMYSLYHMLLDRHRFVFLAPNFFWYFFFMYFISQYFMFLGMMTVAATPNHGLATTIVSSAFYVHWNQLDDRRSTSTVHSLSIRLKTYESIGASSAI